MTKTIKDMPRTIQPRERLGSLGIENLTSDELVALLISSGTKKRNVLSVARELLKNFPINKLSQTSIKDLSNIKGIGEVKAGKILAGVELGRRTLTGTTPHQILTPKDVFHEVKDICNKSQEYLLAIYLNARHELIQKQTISVGTLNQTIIEPRDIFFYALTLPSPFIILVHNHPSNNTTPSHADIQFTQKLVEAGKLLGINIIDHIIVSSKSYTSFRQLDLM